MVEDALALFVECACVCYSIHLHIRAQTVKGHWIAHNTLKLPWGELTSFWVTLAPPSFLSLSLSLSLSLLLARSIFLRLLTVWLANWKFGKRRPCHTHTHTPADSANKRDRRICVWSRGRTSVRACLRIIGNGSAIYCVGLKSFAEEVTGIIPAFFSLWHDGDKDDDNDERYLSWIMK